VPVKRLIFYHSFYKGQRYGRGGDAGPHALFKAAQTHLRLITVEGRYRAAAHPPAVWRVKIAGNGTCGQPKKRRTERFAAFLIKFALAFQFHCLLSKQFH